MEQSERSIAYKALAVPYCLKFIFMHNSKNSGTFGTLERSKTTFYFIIMQWPQHHADISCTMACRTSSPNTSKPYR